MCKIVHFLIDGHIFFPSSTKAGAEDHKLGLYSRPVAKKMGLSSTIRQLETHHAYMYIGHATLVFK